MATQSLSSRHRSTLSLQKTEITIHVYDLLPPGKMSSVLWAMGASLLHSGVVIRNREYAYGGHDERGVTGVYWTKPKEEPPGGTFRCEILHGFSLASQQDIDDIVHSVSREFLGTSYNLLTKNCNHFTSYLCHRLTGTPGPSWLNRAASIGVALPCIVPDEWLEPPDYDTAEGALLGRGPHDAGDSNTDEQHHVLTQRHSRPPSPSPSRSHLLADGTASQGNSDDEQQTHQASTRGRQVRDSAGRRLPAAERAPRH
ncbi:hypothetical protein CDD82_151 [Ophiocordyceps australis]|uniref:PPPDE domain-containing protein n=1 Tax=Ophiocordyceps australis TaxID=1399860 RepID=A0A2C5YMY8_9HYPO|nr:hypothetical protein CDD82_151 [Ophiocordyceps australis]